MISLDLNIIQGSYEISLHADLHGLFMYCGQQTTSVIWIGRAFYCNDDKIAVCDMNHTRGSSTSYIILYKMRVEWVYNQNIEDGKWYIPIVPASFIHLIKYMSRNRHRNKCRGQCVLWCCNIYLVWTYRGTEYCFCTYPPLRYFCPQSYFRMMGWKNTTDLLYVRFTWWIKAKPLECSRLNNWFSQSGLGFGWITCLLSGDSLVGIYFWKTVGFYQRPVLASGYCRCLRLSVRQSVRHQVCPRDYSSPIQARITKFGP